MSKDTLELLLLVTQSAYIDYLGELSKENPGWSTDDGKKYPLMITYEKAIAELKSALGIDK